MLSYELCQRLKDAGFPQNTTMSWWKCDYVPDPYLAPTDESEGDAPASISAASPTTDDLLRELGEGTILWEHEKEWHAGKPTGQYCVSEIYVDDYPHPCRDGDTPEEALCNLYLALHP